MFDEPTLAEAVGLKHVIEDGLAIIEGRPLGEARRNFVVHDLSELIDRAIRGSQIASQPTLFLGEDDRQAFGSFALIDRYLGAGRTPSWLHQAPDALRVLERIRKTEVPDQREKQAAVELLGALLSQLSAESALETGTRDVLNPAPR